MCLFTLNLKYKQGQGSPDDALCAAMNDGGGELEVTVGVPAPPAGSVACAAHGSPMGMPWGVRRGCEHRRGVGNTGSICLPARTWIPSNRSPCEEPEGVRPRTQESAAVPQ